MIPVHVAAAGPADADALAAVAAATFPLACPPSATAENIAAFVDANLSSGCFATYLADPQRLILTARSGTRIVGYAMLVDGVSDDPDVAGAVTDRPAVELSKIYVLPDAHGSGTAAQLMAAAISRARARGAVTLWLGVNQENQRAQRFYAKHGFVRAGTKTFRLGARVENDYVLTRRV